MNSLLEANISEIDLEIEEPDETIGLADNTEYIINNFSEDGIPEVPFVHWSIYR